MKKRNLLKIAIFFTLLFLKDVEATELETPVKDVRKDLVELRKLLQENYSLGSHKKETWSYDLKEVINNQLQELKGRTEPVGFEEYKKILKECLYESGDNGLDVLFNDSRCYGLPFRVLPVEGKFIVHISSCELIQPGDELISLDGLSPVQFMQALKKIPPLKEIEDSALEELGYDADKRAAWRFAFANRQASETARGVTNIYGATSLVPTNDEVELVLKSGSNSQSTYSVTLHWRKGTFDNIDSLSSSSERPYPYALKEYQLGSKEVSAIHLKTLFFPKGSNFEFYRELYAFIADAKQNSDCIILDLRDIQGGFPTNSLFLYLALCSNSVQAKSIHTNHHEAEYTRSLKRRDYCAGQLSEVQQKIAGELVQNTSNPEYVFLKSLESIFTHLYNQYLFYITEYKPNKSVDKYLSSDAALGLSGFFPSLPSIPIFILHNSNTAGEAESLIQFLKTQSHVHTAGELTKGQTSSFTHYDQFRNGKVARLWISYSTPLIVDSHSGLTEHIDGFGILPDLPLALEAHDLQNLQAQRGRGPSLFKKDVILQKLLEHIASTD